MNGHAIIRVGRMLSSIAGTGIPAEEIDNATSYSDATLAKMLHGKDRHGMIEYLEESGKGTARGHINRHPSGSLSTSKRASRAVRRQKALDKKVHLFNMVDYTFPTGLLDIVKDTLFQYDITYEIKYESTPPVKQYPQLKLTDKYRGHALEMRDYQREGLELSRNNRMGMYNWATNAGKTLLATSIMVDKGVKTLVLVQKKEDVHQWIDHFIGPYLGIKAGILMSHSKCLRPITVGLVQTVSSMLTDPQWNKKLLDYGFEMIFIDEAHHAASATHFNVIRKLDPYYIYGMTGTAMRNKKAEEVCLTASFRSVLSTVDNQHLWDKGYSKPVEIVVSKITQRLPEDGKEWDWSKAYNTMIVGSGWRNNIIVKDILEAYSQGRSVLVLVEQIQHCDNLTEILKTKGVRFGVGHAGKTDEERRRLVHEFRNGDLKILIGTLYHQSLDVDRISSIINAGAMKSPIRVIQGLGRGLRTGEDDKCTYRDYIDIGSHYLEDHAYNRMKSLEKAGCELPILAKEHIAEIEKKVTADIDKLNITESELAEAMTISAARKDIKRAKARGRRQRND